MSEALLAEARGAAGVVPSLTTVERDAYSAPWTPFLIWNSTTLAYNVWNGAAWIVLAAVTSQQATFAQEGALIPITKLLRIPNNLGATKTITGVYLMADTAPTGAAIIVDVRKNGVTIFTNSAHRPQIAAATNSGFSTSVDVPAWAAGEYLQFSIVQVGATIAGSDLTVGVVFR